MKQHLNTLYVTTPGAYLKKDGEAVAVVIERETRLRMPLHHLGAIVAFGSVGASPGLMAACGQAGVAISFLSHSGRFMARVTGFTQGNVLLRREQYRRADDAAFALSVARPIVQAKIANARGVLLRATRDHPDSPAVPDLSRIAERLKQTLDDVERADNADSLRGLEGDAARHYFSVFNGLITAGQEYFIMKGRSRRPPLDPVNALLSFVYSMLTQDARAACETCGLDSAVGFLHADRPGRPALALDLIEELRPFLADRLVLSLINRRQVSPEGFVLLENGAVEMNDETRKTVLTALQKRKQEEITHPFLNEATTVGLIPHLQARLLARFIRGELDGYPPFLWK